MVAKFMVGSLQLNAQNLQLLLVGILLVGGLTGDQLKLGVTGESAAFSFLGSPAFLGG